eukprot:gene52772-12330_t
MWGDTLLVFTSDNGGPVYGNGTAGANNWPLRGGKMSNWEGGIRARLPDWRAAAAGLPPVDSVSAVGVLLGTAKGARTELALGTEPRRSSLHPEGTTVNGVIVDDADGLWKLLTGP